TAQKYWRYDYVLKGVAPKKERADGKACQGARRTLSIGTFPQIDAEAAVAALKQAKEDLKAGIDPVDKRRNAEATVEEAPQGPFFRGGGLSQDPRGHVQNVGIPLPRLRRPQRTRPRLRPSQDRAGPVRQPAADARMLRLRDSASPDRGRSMISATR